jgi:hypothetical protein
MQRGCHRRRRQRRVGKILEREPQGRQQKMAPEGWVQEKIWSCDVDDEGHVPLSRRTRGGTKNRFVQITQPEEMN